MLSLSFLFRSLSFFQLKNINGKYIHKCENIKVIFDIQERIIKIIIEKIYLIIEKYIYK